MFKQGNIQKLVRKMIDKVNEYRKKTVIDKKLIYQTLPSGKEKHTQRIVKHVILRIYNQIDRSLESNRR